MIPPATPLRFSSTTEKIQDDEATTNAELVEELLKISQITYTDGHKALRSVHAKSHGIVKGKLTVAGGLPPVLAQGLFSVPGQYPATFQCRVNIRRPCGFRLRRAIYFPTASPCRAEWRSSSKVFRGSCCRVRKATRRTSF